MLRGSLPIDWLFKVGSSSGLGITVADAKFQIIAREQHIRREKATSNICTSQALLANMAAMYAVYHGPEGLKRIARKVHALTQLFKSLVEKSGYRVANSEFFDTLTIYAPAANTTAEALHKASTDVGINLRRIDDEFVGVTLDESVGLDDLIVLANVFATAASASPVSPLNLPHVDSIAAVPSALQRKSTFLPHAVFNTHHSETEMLRYIYHLQSKDLGLVHAMIPLGSCTMKLNSTSSMVPLTWPEFSTIHPFAPKDQVSGYLQVIKVCLITPCISTHMTNGYSGIGVRFMQDHWVPRMFSPAQLWCCW